MTDNEIIKALECCRDFGDCYLCPYEKATFENEADCAERMHTDALDLINRQKAEIERLQGESIGKCELAIAMRDDHNLDSNCNYCIDKARSEAIKEFAEKLKESAFDCDVSFGYGREHYEKAVAVVEIDNLVKEMTE